ncbi:Hypothetical protein I595_783 [Croceitalea dokdonensis DOKDO 023]|uniref:Uncharacterized protein n=1 Tax=Croceitalea dokdonensis DOKDO 023 TaxID=1300341 RepID=A0A0P7AWD7_9FLAO|nr:Hypothetical protein I595_783 [Croceitalea dokdonensis DOKDO 023]
MAQRGKSGILGNFYTKWWGFRVKNIVFINNRVKKWNKVEEKSIYLTLDKQIKTA